MLKTTNSSNMRNPMQMKIQRHQKPIPTNWLEFINDDRLRLAIPVGPRFQANVPNWTDPPHIGDYLSATSSSRWLGTRIWPIKGRSRPENKEELIGKGRPNSCSCISPGSVECVRLHITDKRIQLQLDLGPAFWRWKFDEMGEEVLKVWNLEEEKKFEYLVKMNPISQGKCFMKPALKSLLSHCRQTIVSYYFNVYVPRRMSIQTRSGCTIIDTDDEAREAPDSKNSGKRCRANCATTSYSSSKFVKTKYLTGRR